ncbi:MAG: MFS transporter [Verrucomicrobiota bacterium]
MTLFRPDRPFQPKKVRFYYGWVIAAAGTVGVICSIPGQTMGVSVFTDSLIENLGISRTWISFAYLIGTICSGFLVVPVGWLLDASGFRSGGVYAGLGLGVALLFLSQVDRIAEGVKEVIAPDSGVVIGFIFVTAGFFLLRFCGQGVMTLVSRGIVAKWFNHYRGRVTAITGIIGSFAFSVTPLFFDGLIIEFGWRVSWVGLGIICGFVFAVFAWVVFRDNPEECGLEMDGGLEKIPESKVNPDNRVVKQYSTAEALGTYGFWIYNLAFSFQGLFITGYTFHILSVADDLGLAREVVLGAFFPGAVIGVFVSLGIGWLIDKTQLKYSLIVFTIGTVFIPLGLLFAPHQYSLIILIAGFAMGGGAFSPLIGTVWARFYGRKSLGAISGFNMSCLVIGSALGPIGFSLSYEFLGGYRPAIAISVGCGVLLLAGAFFAENPQRKLREEMKATCE